MTPDEFVVTPYEVKGRIDYVRLRELFGTQELTPELLARLYQIAGGNLPPLLTRGVYYSHRDLGLLLDQFTKGSPFFLYSGGGRPDPSTPPTSSRSTSAAGSRRRSGSGCSSRSRTTRSSGPGPA